MMSLAANPGQVIYLDGAQFPVPSGANFDFSATLGFDPSADGVAVVSVIFLDADTRTNIRVEPIGRQLPAVTTDADGSFAFDLPDAPEEITVEITALGDLDTWPALLSTTLSTTPAESLPTTADGRELNDRRDSQGRTWQTRSISGIRR